MRPFGLDLPPCDRAEGCRASYGPKAVVFSHGTNQSYQSLHLDRVTGRILHIENLKEFGTPLFEGQCMRTDMPRPYAKGQV